jgi:major intracellular serine protease
MENIIKLPDFKVEQVVSAMSEIIDWGLRQNKIPNTWTVTMGEESVVYVLDTGCSDHIDLQENSLCGGGFIDGEDAVDNASFHSTHCMGIIAASQNGFGVVGVAPKCRVVAIKCLGDNGFGSERAIVNALKFCVDAKDGLHEHVPPPDIVSMSLGASGPMPNVHRWIKELYKRDIPVICAAGNERSGVCYPAKYPEAIAIGAYGENGEIANFSNYGPEIDFAGPGVHIYSTYGNNKYARLSGTCLVGDTMVYTVNGPKEIRLLSDFDVVYSFNGEGFDEKRVLKAWSNGPKNIFELATRAGKKIKCTENHPFLTSEGVYVRLDELKIGDILMASDGERLDVDAVKSISPAGVEEVFDIEVEDNHNFIANGLIAHNSMATPFIAGIVALMISKHKKQERETGKNDCRTVEQIKEHLIKYSMDSGEAGKDHDFGYGIIDVHKLILEEGEEDAPEKPEEPKKPEFPKNPQPPWGESFWSKTLRKLRNFLRKL